MAKAASERNRPTPATSATILAAVSTPHPGHPTTQLGLELVGPQGQLPAAAHQLPDDADLHRVRQVGRPGLELLQDPPQRSPSSGTAPRMTAA